ncbi:hypothetical protein [Solemya elarraichensis gill symbiont]|uniref:hypothetical protein n=1 Tax=Solemya elarraichensis gill symbiont TaxID=1918949 RepID=UPI001083206D|nr:hypothetical protein [Solemya elarraichensis gill symbiont]
MRINQVTMGLIVAFLLLSGCVSTPVPMHHKTGVKPQKQTSDLTACQVNAVNAVPASMQVRRTPIFTTRTKTNCYTMGDNIQCDTTGGQISGGDVHTYDANADLRERVTDECMTKKGYIKYQLRRCTPSEVKNSPTSNTTFPPVTEMTCVKQGPTGRWVLVNPE